MVSVNCDATIILGNFTLENGTHNSKLLLLRTNGILSNAKYPLEEKNAMTSAIYKSIRPLAGKRGYELRQFCGSSRGLTAASDKDMLRVMSIHEGALLRKLWATVIVSGNGP